MNSRYLDQVGRMLQILPHVMGEKVFALKGGTAINFFIRDVPRLSVDIDLVYTPVQDRVTSLSEISTALLRIKGKILSHFGKVTITEKRISGDYCIKLFENFKIRCLSRENGNLVFLGSKNSAPPEKMPVSLPAPTDAVLDFSSFEGNGV